MQILGVRDHSRHELRQKLLARGYEEDEIEGALDRLEGYGYLDEAKYAELLVRSHSDRGRRGLADLLRRKGVDEDVWRPLLADLDSEEELSRALQAARKHSPPEKVARLPRETWRRRLAAFLGRRGFSASTSMQVSSMIEEEARAALLPGASTEADHGHS